MRRTTVHHETHFEAVNTYFLFFILLFSPYLSVQSGIIKPMRDHCDEDDTYTNEPTASERLQRVYYGELLALQYAQDKAREKLFNNPGYGKDKP